jgi:hypothetical protein
VLAASEYRAVLNVFLTKKFRTRVAAAAPSVGADLDITSSRDRVFQSPNFIYEGSAAARMHGHAG